MKVKDAIAALNAQKLEGKQGMLAGLDQGDIQAIKEIVRALAGDIAGEASGPHGEFLNEQAFGEKTLNEIGFGTESQMDGWLVRLFDPRTKQSVMANEVWNQLHLDQGKVQQLYEQVKSGVIDALSELMGEQTTSGKMALLNERGVANKVEQATLELMLKIGNLFVKYRKSIKDHNLQSDLRVKLGGQYDIDPLLGTSTEIQGLFNAFFTREITQDFDTRMINEFTKQFIRQWASQDIRKNQLRGASKTMGQTLSSARNSNQVLGTFAEFFLMKQFFEGLVQNQKGSFTYAEIFTNTKLGDLNQELTKRGIDPQAIGMPAAYRGNNYDRQTDAIIFLRTNGGDNYIIILEAKASQQVVNPYSGQTRELLKQRRLIEDGQDYYEKPPLGFKQTQVITVGIMVGLFENIQGYNKWLPNVYKNLRDQLKPKKPVHGWDFILWV